MHVQAVLFDVDDTMYDELSYVASGFQAVAHHLEMRSGMSADILSAEMLEILRTSGRGRIFDDLLQRHALTSENRVSDLVNIYRAHAPSISLDDEVRSCFAALRQRALKIGVVTDGLHLMQRQKIAALGLRELADVIVYTDEMGKERWKPHPEPFRFAAQQLGAEPGEAVYVGNDPAKDFPGPRSLGMQTIHLARTGSICAGPCQADLHLASIVELPAALDFGMKSHHAGN